MISLIVAASTNNAIGKSGKLLWHLPNDMKFFKDTTWGMPVLMGRKTFEALPRPLPGRINIVISRSAEWNISGTYKVNDLPGGLRMAAETNCREIFIIGGGEIYLQSMELAERIYMTRVHAELDGDTFFPVLDNQIWELKENKDFGKDEKHQYAYSIQVWEKR